jgi:hypothetical protein
MGVQAVWGKTLTPIRIRKPRILEKLPTLFVEKTLDMPPKTATFSTKSILSSKPLFVPKKKEYDEKKYFMGNDALDVARSVVAKSFEFEHGRRCASKVSRHSNRKFKGRSV